MAIDTQYPVAGRLCAQTRLFTSATFCNASVKERFGLFSHALQLLFELSQFVTRKSCKHFLHCLDVRAENWRDDGFSAGVKATTRTRRSSEDSVRLTKPLARSRSTATLIDPGVRLTFRTDHVDGQRPLVQ